MPESMPSRLREALERLEPEAGPDDRLGLVLAWLADSGRSGPSRELTELLGRAGDDPALLGAVFNWLDGELFIGERLDTERAGIGPERSRFERRRRFRQLLGAFHPDRFPDQADWLTARSQRITRAYSDFKRGIDEPAEPALDPRPTGKKHKKGRGPVPPAYEGITPNWRGPHIPAAWRERIARQRFLAHKLVLGLALIALLPLVSLMLDSTPPPEWPEAPESTGAPITAAPEGLALEMPFWPPPAREITWQDFSRETPLTPRLDHEVAARWLAHPAGNPMARPDAPAWLRGARAVPVPESPAVWGGLVEQRFKTTTVHRLVQGQRLWGQTLAPLADIEPSRLAGPAIAGEDPPPEAAEPVPESVPEPPPEPPAEESSMAVIETPEEPVPQPQESSEALPEEAPPREAAAAETGSGPGTPAADSVSGSSEAALDRLREHSVAIAETRDRIRAERAAEPPTGSVTLGLLANNAAGAVLAEFQAAFEAGDLDTLETLLAGNARINQHRGRRWVRRYYNDLFSRTQHRALSLQVASAQRDGETWFIETHYELQLVTTDDSPASREQGRMRWELAPEGGRLRVGEVRY